MESIRIDHELICQECYERFKGFEHQTTCWSCIQAHLEQVMEPANEAEI